ncbi:hypothetical protein TIFTF001_004693 [Ficus carica]|uniref:Uncharacterized protein n=1 Tax=Ficus carica TaxID=3494 RepID=A0AA87ZH32_FICCA|nr:hypothetical protein TIFTF001_004693 [Ficus carica]
MKKLRHSLAVDGLGGGGGDGGFCLRSDGATGKSSRGHRHCGRASVPDGGLVYHIPSSCNPPSLCIGGTDCPP